MNVPQEVVTRIVKNYHQRFDSFKPTGDKEKDAEISAIKASLSRYKTDENSKNGFDEWFSNNKFLDRLSPVKRKGKEIA